MLGRTTRMLGIALICLGIGPQAACNPEVKSCPQVAGYFEPLYTPVDGTCGPIDNPNMVPFDAVSGGSQTNVMRLANGVVTTEVISKGCTIHMTQMVEMPDGGGLEQKIDGNPLTIIDENKLMGPVSLTRYDAATGEVTCAGTYMGMFTKYGTNMPVGGAASGLGVAGAGD